MGRKLKKPTASKIRHGWEINPKTRIGPNKRCAPVVCTLCGGLGGVHWANGEEGSHEDCMGCGGTGYAD